MFHTLHRPDDCPVYLSKPELTDFTISVGPVEYGAERCRYLMASETRLEFTWQTFAVDFMAIPPWTIDRLAVEGCCLTISVSQSRENRPARRPGAPPVAPAVRRVPRPRHLCQRNYCRWAL